jgi:predicted transcriptional regulator
MLDNKLVSTRYDQEKGQQIEITDLGIKLNEIFEHMKKVDKV